MSWQFLTENWAVFFAAAVMIVGAVIDGWKLKVPNWLTLPMILSGWLYWAVRGSTEGWDYFVASVLGAFAAGALLILPYAIGGMGAGDVKLYAGFGAWFVPFQWFGYDNLLWAFAISVFLGAAMALVMIWHRKSAPVNMENAKDIVHDWATAKSFGEVFDKAKRKPSLQLLPYGVPLTIGSLAYIAYVIPTANALMLVALTTGI